MIRTTKYCVYPSKKFLDIGGNDHLSNLHESVLSNILSLLPTEEVVRTSILSKAWKYKWTCIYNMNINDYYRERGSDKDIFVKFVDRTISFTKSVKSFRLICNGCYGVDFVKSWICDVLSCGVEMFEVCHWGSTKDEHVVLPWSLLDKSSLKRLELVFQCTFYVVTKNCFRNLTSFYLSSVWIQNGNSNSDTLVLQFPILKIFEVIRCTWVNVKFVKIQAPMLNTFVSKTEFSGRPNDYSIKILGSRFLRIKCLGGFPENIIVCGSPFVAASFHNDDLVVRLLRSLGIQVQKLLNGFSCLNELELSGFLVQALQAGHPLCKYDKLKRLRLVAPGNAAQLFEFLQVAPSLEFLYVNVFNWDKYDYGVLELLPCIVSHLKEVTLVDFRGTPSQYDLANFFLENGEVLEKIYISSPCSHLREAIMQKLSAFRRILTSVKIVFQEMHSLTIVVVS